MARYVNHEGAEAALRPAEPAAHWKKLRQGDRVGVCLTPGFETGGVVEAITWDHTAVWVDLDGGRGRILVHCSDGVEIVPQEG
jgi:translation initiation factor IF-1